MTTPHTTWRNEGWSLAEIALITSEVGSARTHTSLHASVPVTARVPAPLKRPAPTGSSHSHVSLARRSLPIACTAAVEIFERGERGAHTRSQ